MRVVTARAVVALFCGMGLAGQTPNPDALEASLPATGMVFAAADSGAPLQIHGTETKFNPHAAGNLLRGFVYAGPQSSADIDGAVATTHLYTSSPVLYVRLAGDDPEILTARVKLVSLTPTKATRVVAVYTANVFGGHRKRFVDEVPVTKMTTKDSQWLRLTPEKPLEPGEYAVVALPKDTVAVPETVYDFAIGGEPKLK